MRFDDQHVTNGLSESRSPFFLCALVTVAVAHKYDHASALPI
jgi:hypothetical protein